MIFPRDGIQNLFHKSVHPIVEEMANGPTGPAGISHTLNGVGIVDSSSTSEHFGGMAERCSEWNFISLHMNTVTSMSGLGGIMLAIGVLLY